jgi:hypothetical protein
MISLNGQILKLKYPDIQWGEAKLVPQKKKEEEPT